jgi:hypothetical protein
MILEMYVLISPLGDILVLLFVPDKVIFLIFMKVAMEMLYFFIFFLVPSRLSCSVFLAAYRVPCS